MSHIRPKTAALLVVLFMMVGAFIVPMVPISSVFEATESSTTPSSAAIQKAAIRALSEDATPYPASIDLDSFLGNRENDYKTIYEPWLSKAAVHAVSYDSDTGFLAVGGGYLYDNEVHLFRYNLLTDTFDKVMEIGDGVMNSDVLSIDFGDTDLNDFIEIVVGCADGHIYVFEQRHLYDPYMNTENMFDLVWSSPGFFKVFAVKVDDVDRDYRPDIIAGCWDGKVRLFEYDNHSGYPFVAEHWITYRQVSVLNVGEKVYTLESGDTNYNGLPDIVVGTRDGTVFVFENAGTTIMINGQPFPLIRDNAYRQVWTSGNYTWQPIRSMAVGELDGTPGDEIALVTEGQGVFTLNWEAARANYRYEKVQREFAEWESFGFHGLDYYVDRVVSANNVTYHDPVNASLIVSEPIVYVWNEDLQKFLPDASVYPYNTGMARAWDGNFSTFDASIPGVDSATAIVDFGLDEEGTGSANADRDVVITFHTLDSGIFAKFNFSIGQTATDFTQVDSSRMTISASQLSIDVDDVLIERHWDWFRYAKLVVYNGGNYRINSLELKHVYNLLTEALSLTIGPMDFDGYSYFTGESELDKIVIGTSIGEYICVGYDGDSYEVLWESYDDDRYKLDRYIWDLEYIDTKSTAANYLLGSSLSLDSTALNAWSHGVASPLTVLGGDGLPRYFVGGVSGDYAVYDMRGELDVDFMNLLVNLPGYIADPYVALNLAWLWPEEGHLPFIFVSRYDPEADYTADSYFFGRAGIEIFSHESVSEPYTWAGPIVNYDATQDISQVLQVATTTPRLSFADVDNDGDLDFAMSVGKLYLVKNLYEEMGSEGFCLDQEYFRSINEQGGSAVWGQPDLFDLDADGDLDVVLSFASNWGVTCFINEGSSLQPIWSEDRQFLMNSNPETALTILHLKDLQFIPNTGGYTLQKQAEATGYELQGDYHWGAINSTGGKLTFGVPVYDTMDSYMVATNPYVSRTDFCLRTGGGFKNVGFHMHESWNTNFDLQEWTLSISSGDVDGDGRGEIVVGDFDNNVYSFEHLVNSTYKRMFRSPDLCHTIVTDETPYAYGELEGLSGDFYRRIFDHATHLVVGTDIDQDDHRELIVASSLQIYIFEATGVDDTLSLAYTIDLRDLGYIDPEFADWEGIDSITVLQAGSDLDSDRRMELLVGAGPYLLIYNVETGEFAGMETNDFFGDASDGKGRYYLFGSPLAGPSFENALISALAVGDTDGNGHPEVFAGGIVDTRIEHQNGFLVSYECVGGTFRLAWEAPSSITHWNPISSIIIDDQDYDGIQEVIVGHSHGIDILEYMQGSDSKYRVLETVSSSPNYPEIDVSRTQPESIYSLILTNRSFSDMVWLEELNIGLGAITSDTQLCIVAYNVSGSEILVGGFGGYIFSPASYGPGSTIVSEAEPSMALTREAIYMTWRTSRADGTYDMWISMLNFSVGSWENPVSFYANCLSRRTLPHVFEYNETHIGIMYLYEPVFGIDSVRYHIIDKELSGGWSPSAYLVPDIPSRTKFNMQGFSIEHMPSGEFALAFSAVDSSSSKADYDIFFVMANSSFGFAGSIVHRVTDSYYYETYPHLDYMRSDNTTLLIAYEQRYAAFEDQIGIVASRNSGTTWTEEQNLNPIAPYMNRFDSPDGYGYYYYQNYTYIPIYGPRAYSPTIVAHTERGLLYIVPIVATGIDMGYDLVYGWVRDDQWIDTTLPYVEDMAVGDTDCDARREIVATFGDRFGVVELLQSNNGTGHMTYSQAYVSEPYDWPLTGVTVYDSNGNGWEEIAVSAEHGNAYVLEYVDSSDGATVFGYSVTTDNLTTIGMAWDTAIVSGDVDADLKDELLLTPLGGGFQLFDDNGTLLWNVTNSFSFGTQIRLEDINGDSTPEIIGCDQNGHPVAYNVTNGSLLWNCSSLADEVQSYDIGDLNGDGLLEVVVGTDGGTGNAQICIINSTGLVWHVLDIEIGDVWAVAVGHFDEGLVGVAYANDTYAVKAINPFDGTVLFDTLNNMVPSWSPQAFITADMNGDTYDEVIFGKNVVRIADVYHGRIIYNLTISQYLSSRGLIADDFDGDRTTELLVVTRDSGVYLIEANTLCIQWHYTSDLGQVQSATYGYFGGTGKYDVLLSLNSTSTVIALDGKSGLPMFLNYTGQYVQGLGAVDFDGDGVDSALAWIFPYPTVYSHLLFLERASLSEWEWTRAYNPRGEYWARTSLTEEYENAWTFDVNPTSYDEVVVRQGSFLTLIDAYRDVDLWSSKFSGTISEVRFGNLNNAGNRDLAVVVDSNKVLLLNGDTGVQLGAVTSPSASVRIVDCIVANFRTGTSYEYDEIAILFENTGDTKSYVVWYNYNLKASYVSSVNGTRSDAYMTSGRFNGASTYDIAFGCDDQNVRFYAGNTGTFIFQVNIGVGGDKMVSGDFDKILLHDAVAVQTAYGIDIISSSTQTEIGSVSMDYQTLVDIYSADIEGDFANEVAALVRNAGVTAYNATGDATWRFDTQLRVPVYGADVGFSFRNMDSDSYADLVLRNNNYITVISGATRDLLWHYVTDEPMTVALPGKLDSTLAPFDVFVLSSNRIAVVSGSEKVPLPPSPGVQASSIESILLSLAAVLAVGAPMSALLAKAVLRTRRAPLQKIPSCVKASS